MPRYLSSMNANNEIIDGLDRYHREVITVFFSFFTLKEIVELSKLSRQFYYITGLKDTIRTHSHVSRTIDAEAIIRPPVKTSNEIENFNIFDREVAADQLISCQNAPDAMLIRPLEKNTNFNFIADEYDRVRRMSQKHQRSNSHRKNNKILATPYWSICSSGNKSVSLDQIIVNEMSAGTSLLTTH